VNPTTTNASDAGGRPFSPAGLVGYTTDYLFRDLWLRWLPRVRWLK
jgi:hypothetical protein